MFSVQTSLGPIPLWGRLGEGPLLFVIRGVMSHRAYLEPLAQRLPNVVLVHLPGMHTPFFAENSVEAFAAAYDEVLDTLGRPAAVVGASLGGVAALAMKRASRLLLIDPPLTTPLPDLEPILEGPARRHPQAARWFSDLLGYTPSGWTPKDYTPLLSGLRVPAHLLAASRGYCPPLSRPLIRTTLVDASHQVTYEAPDVVMGAIDALLAEAVEAERPRVDVARGG
jgi:pimeloyl-ACP methyl ester carboxylesterase